MTDAGDFSNPRGGTVGALERRARADAFDAARTWVDPNGYQLSDRVWLAGKTARGAIDRALVNAIATGESPLVTARKLERYLSPTWAPRRDEKGRLVAKQPKQIVTRTPSAGAGSHAARRLARTEITRSHGQATIAAAKRNPFTKGIKWQLSASHGSEGSDTCDGYANRDGGLGRGVYAPGRVPSYPQHPHERCTLVPVPVNDTDRVLKRLRTDYGLAPAAPAGVTLPPFVPAATLKDAAATARRMGVKAEYGQRARPPRPSMGVDLNAIAAANLNAANITNEALHVLKARGVPLPPEVHITTDLFNGSAIAYYQPATNQVFANVASPFWADPDAGIKYMRGQGWLVGESPADVMIHEVGHQLHPGSRYSILRPQTATLELTANEAAIASQLSRYAATTQGEFVAETFVQLVRGRPVSPEVLAQYRKFGGYEP